MKLWDGILKFLEGFNIHNRCPNCEGLFSENGEGGLTTCIYRGSDGEETGSEEVTICLKCLENSSYLNKDRIKEGLQKRGRNKDEIEQAMDAIDLYLKGELACDIWNDPS